MISLLTAYLRYDPAARNRIEVLLLYPGIKAIFFHRIAYFLRSCGIPFLPRLLSEVSRFVTGIEIHPGAQIGRHVIFDHGMGIVIGETAVVGDRVILYQAVTLGGTSRERIKRHPTLECGVVVGAGAKILGNITVGEGSRIGANSVVVKDVPPRCTVVGNPGKVLLKEMSVGQELHHEDICEDG